MPPSLKKQIKDFDETLVLNDETLHLVQYWDDINSKYITRNVKQSTINNYYNTSINITYDQLKNLIDTNTLKPQQLYRLTDYRSYNFLNGYNTFLNPPSSYPNMDPNEIYESDIEVLYVKAQTTNTVYPVSYSETYPDDLIYYDPTINNKLLSIDYYTGGPTPFFNFEYNLTDGVHVVLPNPIDLNFYFYLIASFNGGADNVEFEIANIDNLINPTINDDWSTIGNPISIEITDGGTKVKFPTLTEADYNNYDSDTLFLTTQYSVLELKGLITRRYDTKNNINIPADWRNIRYRRFAATPLSGSVVDEYFCIADGYSVSYIDTVDMNNYQDMPIFSGKGGNVTILINDNILDNFDNNILNGVSNTLIITPSFIENYISNATEMYIYSTFEKNLYTSVNRARIYGYNAENDIGNFNDNLITKDFTTNIAQDFNNNIVNCVFISNQLVNFSTNILNNIFFSSNIIDGVFINNHLTDGYFDQNQIGTNFRNNQIHNNFILNVIGTTFELNQIFYEFTSNTVVNNFNSNIINANTTFNFTLSTHVYGAYNCTILTGSDLNVYLQYFDGAVMNYVVANT